LTASKRAVLERRNLDAGDQPEVSGVVYRVGRKPLTTKGTKVHEGNA
jgi:hypothetical protein